MADARSLALLQATTELHVSGSAEAIAATLITTTLSQLDFDGAGVSLVSDDHASWWADRRFDSATEAPEIRLWSGPEKPRQPLGDVLTAGEQFTTQAGDPRVGFLSETGLKTLTFTPIATPASLMGVLMAGKREDEPPGSAILGALSMLARHAAIALSSSESCGERLRTVSERADRSDKLTRKLLNALEEERKRISRELHDDTAQQLTSLILRLDMCRSRAGEDGELGNSLLQLKEMAESTLEGVHQMALNLRPTMLDHLGLIPTIRWYIQNCFHHETLAVELEVSGEHVKLDPQVEIVALRIVQEALTNVQKHAGAKRAWVNLRFTDSDLMATIRDDGCGFEVGPTLDYVLEREALGLMGMRERAELLSGEFSIESAPAKGTTVNARIPLDP